MQASLKNPTGGKWFRYREPQRRMIEEAGKNGHTFFVACDCAYTLNGGSRMAKMYASYTDAAEFECKTLAATPETERHFYEMIRGRCRLYLV
jgi:hypothetical protein